MENVMFHGTYRHQETTFLHNESPNESPNESIRNNYYKILI